MKKRLLTLIILSLLLLPVTGTALAQNYLFELPEKVVDVYWNEDGTQSLAYTWVFKNDPGGHAIDYVDAGMPNAFFDVNTITADVDGFPITFISKSEYQGGGHGVALGLGAHAIPPGQSGTVYMYVGAIENVLYPDDVDETYVSAVFAPNYFDRSIIKGNTNLTVYFHLPPGVQPEEPRWHSAPSGFPSEPQTGFDDQGNIVYAWTNPNANGYTQYSFGASFPAQYIPPAAIVRGSPGASVDFDIESLFAFGCIGFVVLIVFSSVIGNRSRKLKYLPPKIAIEGHGIKRGLTAIEAAILLEQPLDKVMTMILFSAIKKNAAEVISRDPLEIKSLSPLPEGLHAYETDFLKAFQKKAANRRKALQETMVDLVKSVSGKMKGFSRKESIAYYRDIMQRAWAQVEAAEIPEVKSQAFDEVMEWTMLDRDYDDRTRRVFRDTPVFVPTWWGRYDPGYGSPSVGKTASPISTSVPTPSKTSLPQLPGSDFAASMVNGVQTFSSKVVGNIGDFTGRVTQTTNPVPKTTSSSGRGGGISSSGGCACACACAGCACACAGGGR